MSFEANNGQADPRVKFLARAQGYTLFLADQEAVLSLSSAPPAPGPAQAGRLGPPAPDRFRRATQAAHPGRVVRLKFLGAETPAAIAGRDQLPGKSNYLIGSDPKQWHTNIPNYAAVEYSSIYPGVDAVFHGENQRLEFDFDLAPGADPHALALEVDGARQIRVDHAGNLLLRMDANRSLIMARPLIYQQTPQGRHQIAGHYVLGAGNRIAFALDRYDRTQPLVIDPTLVYSTYLGGGISQESYANAIAVDSGSPNCSAGCAVVAGTAGADTVPFPTTAGAYNPGPVLAASNFPFVSKLTADGSGLVYSTYFGGTYNGYSTDQIYAIAVDSTGAAYFGGISGSYDDTPTTANSFMPARPSNKPVPFVAKLSPDGSTLVYGTYLDGTPNNDTDGVSGIAVDSSFSAYVTGNTTATDFPTTAGAFQTVFGASVDLGTAFVTKLSPDGSSLVYSTFLGGSTGENVLTRGAGGAIALDSSNDAYLTGNTYSSNFPTKNPYIAACNSPCSDAFVSELNPAGTALVYSTFLGGTTANKDSIGMGIAVDSSNSAFIVGTTSFTNFPVTENVVQSSPGVGFITKLAPNGAGLAYSSYFNGYVDSVAVGPDDSAVLFGYSNTSLPFEYTAGAFTLPACVGGSCFFDFISKFNPEGSELLFSTPIGANQECCGASGVLDPSGTVYIAGSTASLELPTTAGSFEPTLPSNYTGYTPFIAKVSPWSSTSLTITPSTLQPGNVGEDYSPVTFGASGGIGTLSFAVTSGSLPPGITLTTAGVLSGTPTQMGTFPFTVAVFDSNNDTGSQAYSLQIACETITVSPATLSPGTEGTAYPAVTFTETGGIGSTTFSEAGALPTGITFVAPVLSGTPTQTGSFPFQVTATDANSCTGSVDDTLTVNPAGTQTTVTINETITVTDTEPFSSALTDNETITVKDTEPFSSGLVDNESITVSDTEPFSSGLVDNETVTVTDTEPFSAGLVDDEAITVSDADRPYTPLTITPTPATFNASDASGTAGENYGPVTFAASGGTAPLTLTESGTLPSGLTFSNGVLGGTLSPSSAGAYTFSVTATDTYGDAPEVEQGYMLNIKAVPPSFSIGASPDVLTIAQGQTGSTTITATPVGGYAATLALSCSGLPQYSLCSFSENGASVSSIVLTGNNQPVNVELSIETDVNSQLAKGGSTPQQPGTILPALALWWSGSLLGLAALRRKPKASRKNQPRSGLCLILLLTFTAAVGLAGCGGKGSGTTSYVTPIGTSTVTISATPGSGTAQTLSITVTIAQ